jgi:uncharacterized protein YdiU (UPF0061 family)
MNNMQTPKPLTSSSLKAGLKLDQLRFDNRYTRLPAEFFSRHLPEPLLNQRLAHFNRRVSGLLEIDTDEGQRPDLFDQFTGVREWPGSEPFAQCYAGHQFGQFVPRLGDGRALTVAQIRNSKDELWDLQLKGSGHTLYSRQGDGKAVLRSTIREYLCSEAMAGLGIPTTQALAMSASDEPVFREKPETGAMLVRVAPSHIRFGMFEYFYYRHQHEDLKTLGDYVIDNYFSALADTDNPSLSLLENIIESTAKLIAGWQSVGFCHGVMNSDNMSIHGITIDYGPFGFLDTYNSGHICNHSDHSGRYAFDRQPAMGLFNLSCLAQAMLPLISEAADIAVKLATNALGKYEGIFESEYLDLKRRKLGLIGKEAGDDSLYDELLNVMQHSHLDFTNTFRNLARPLDMTLAHIVPDSDPQRLKNWLMRYRERLKQEDFDEEKRVNLIKSSSPAYVLRNYLAEKVIQDAREQNDFTELETMMELLSDPFNEKSEYAAYAEDAPQWSKTLSVSCSS